MTEPARFDVIRTDRLLMRRWLESDRAPFAVLNADPETMRFFPQTLDRAASDALADRIELRFDQQGYGLWALEVAQTGEFIGFTGLNPMPDGVPGAGDVEVGWRLARHAGITAMPPRRPGPRHGGVRRHRRPERDLVYDRCPQRAVPGRDAETGADRGRQVQPSRGASGSPGAAARDLPPVAVAGVVTGTAGG
jgi:hypothetical protein